MRTALYICGIIAVILIIISPFIFCKSVDEYFDEIDMNGEHDLRHLENHEGIDGSFRHCFLASNGEISSERHLQFFWNGIDGATFATTLPYSMFRFEVDDSKSIPTAEFVFTKRLLRKRAWSTFSYRHGSVNPNYFIETVTPHRSFSAVVIRISQEDLEKEIYLPQ